MRNAQVMPERLFIIILNQFIFYIFIIAKLNDAMQKLPVHLISCFYIAFFCQV